MTAVKKEPEDTVALVVRSMLWKSSLAAVCTLCSLLAMRLSHLDLTAAWPCEKSCARWLSCERIQSE